MKILLISDTHGDISKVIEILDRVKGIDMILHCGDYETDARILENCTDIPVISVTGNCDGGSDYRKTVETPAGKLLITHGHMEAVGFTQTLLTSAAEEEGGCIAVCFGHTHVPLCEDTGGLWLINPGSLTEPRKGSRPSCAILRCEENGFYPVLVPYDTLVPSEPPKDPEDPEDPEDPKDPPRGKGGSDGEDPAAKKKKVKGGFLRGLLNYSDRF